MGVSCEQGLDGHRINRCSFNKARPNVSKYEVLTLTKDDRRWLSGLVTVDEEGSVIRQVHSAVQEHFCKQLDQTFALGEQTIAELSITHLLTESFAQGCCPDEISIIAVISHHPSIKYAAQL